VKSDVRGSGREAARSRTIQYTLQQLEAQSGTIELVTLRPPGRPGDEQLVPGARKTDQPGPPRPPSHSDNMASRLTTRPLAVARPIILLLLG